MAIDALRASRDKGDEGRALRRRRVAGTLDACYRDLVRVGDAVGDLPEPSLVNEKKAVGGHLDEASLGS